MQVDTLHLFPRLLLSLYDLKSRLLWYYDLGGKFYSFPITGEVIAATELIVNMGFLTQVVHPSAEEFCQGLDTTCTVKEFRERMNIVVMTLDWKLHIPNIYSFLKIFILHTCATNEVQAWGMYLAVS